MSGINPHVEVIEDCLSPADNLFKVIKFSCADPIRSQLNNLLDPRPRPEQLSLILNLLRKATSKSESVAVVASEAWAYLQDRRLWEVKYPTLRALQEDIQFDDEVAHMLERNKIVTARLQAACKGVRDRWGGWAPEILGDIAPPRFTRHVLEMLNRMSKICTLDAAIPLLREEVARRLRIPKASKYTWLTQSDVSKAVRRLKATSAAPKIDDEGKQTDEVSNFRASNEVEESGAAISTISSGVAHVIACTHESHEDAWPSADERIADADAICNDFIPVVEFPDADKFFDYLGEELAMEYPEMQDMEIGDQIMSNTEEASGARGHSQQRIPSICQCPRLFTKHNGEGSKVTSDDRLDILHQAISFGLQWLCEPHLRALATFTLGLKIDVSLVELQQRLQVLNQNRKTLPELYHQKPLWFAESCSLPVHASFLVHDSAFL